MTVDLNGHSISGSGESAGIFNSGFTDVVVKNGIIEGFAVGLVGFDTARLKFRHLNLLDQQFTSVLIIGTRGVEITDIDVTLPDGGGLPDPGTGHVAEAIRLADVDEARVRNVNVDGGYFGVLIIGESRQSRFLKVESSQFNHIGETGIRIVNAADLMIKNNRVIGTELPDGCYAGVDVVGDAPSARVHIDMNVVNACGFGIFSATNAPNTELHLQGNYLYANDGGIYLNNTQNSRVVANLAALNASSGVFLGNDSHGNVIVNNRAFANGEPDMAHDPSSTPNQWRANFCEVSDGADIDCP